MKNLTAFIEKENAWRSIFNQTPLSIDTPKDIERVAGIIEGKLSPENLTCDGELPAAQVRKIHSFLIACAKELVALDPTVKFYELS